MVAFLDTNHYRVIKQSNNEGDGYVNYCVHC